MASRYEMQAFGRFDRTVADYLAHWPEVSRKYLARKTFDPSLDFRVFLLASLAQ